MLYVTTRSNRLTYPAQQALTQDRAPDGGFFIPRQEPNFSREILARLSGMAFNHRIAEVLNLLLETNLTGWDVDFAIGRKGAKLVSLRHKILIGEFWHNPDWTFQKMEQSLARLVEKDLMTPGSWLKIAVRIALLAAVSTDPGFREDSGMDISVVSGDFLWPVSAWYGRKWGLPLANIVMCCNENKNLWELFCYGQLRTDSAVITTELPEADVSVPEELERLICGCGGSGEVEAFLECLNAGGAYYPDSAMLCAMQMGNYVSAVSTGRMKDAIPGALATHECLLSPGTALAYSGLLDYRAKKGGLRPALVISQDSPLCEAAKVAQILGIREQTLRERF